MADSQMFSGGERNMTSQELWKIDEIVKKSILHKDGNPALYRLQKSTNNVDQPETYKNITFDERNKNKPHKTLLMVGETGTGKTTLINTMINYMLSVKREDKVWFEITDDQRQRLSAHSQTFSVTVYGFYLQESPVDLTIIDTPGYGDTWGIDVDKQIVMSLLKTVKKIHEIDAVCLVIKASQNRLSDRQRYIFEAVQSLFGKDIAENIVILFTHCVGVPPKNALTAVKEAQIKCAVNDRKQPVFFLFDNRQSDDIDEEEDNNEQYKMIWEQSWNISFKGVAGLMKFLNNIKPKTLKMTEDASKKWMQFEANVSNLQSCVQQMELKQKELKQTLEQNEKDKKNDKNFEYEVDVPYKVRVDIDPAVARAATCCTVCEENCHYPGCWWISNLLWCTVMKDDHCRVCTNKCHYSKHIKEAKIYVTKTKKEKRTYEDSKKEYDEKIGENMSLIKKLEEELHQLEKEKMKCVFDVFHCVETLQMIALNTDSLIILQHLDYLIETLKEINEPEKVKTLEDIKKRAGER